MSTMPHARFSVKSTTTRNAKPVRTFAEGLLEEETPAPVRRHDDRPTDLDRAWALGYDLASRNVPALAPTDWPEMLADAFYDGYGTAQAERDWADAQGDLYFDHDPIEEGYGYR